MRPESVEALGMICVLASQRFKMWCAVFASTSAGGSFVEDTDGDRRPVVETEYVSLWGIPTIETDYYLLAS